MVEKRKQEVKEYMDEVMRIGVAREVVGVGEGKVADYRVVKRVMGCGVVQEGRIAETSQRLRNGSIIRNLIGYMCCN